VAEHLWDQLKVEADVADRHVDIVEVSPPWDGVGEHTRGPIARLRYTKSPRQWAIYWRDRNLKFHEYKRKRPTKNVPGAPLAVGSPGDVLEVLEGERLVAVISSDITEVDRDA
jgi:hypothetical protein